MSNFVKNCSNLLQKTVSGVGAFSLVLGSFAFLSNPISVQAATITGNLTNMVENEVREISIDYSSTDYNQVSFPEIRVQIDNTNLEFVDFTNNDPCFDETTNQGIAGLDCLSEVFNGVQSPAITNNDKIFKSGSGPTSGTLAGTADNTAVFSFCPRSSIVGAPQYTAGGRTTSSGDPFVSPLTDPEGCSPADIPNGQTGTLKFWVRVKYEAANTLDAMRIILRSNNGNSEATTTGYDGNGWTNVSMTEMDLTMSDLTTNSVLVNEINWAGSSTSATDQWVELYNTTASEISLDGATLGISEPNGVNRIEYPLNATTCGTTPVIPANGYFLISKLAHTDPLSLLNVQSDCIISSLTMNTAGNGVGLLVGNLFIDSVQTNQNGGWEAGSNQNCNGAGASRPCVSMARRSPVFSSSWENSLAVLNEDTSLQNPGANIIAGRKTPKLANRALGLSTRTGVYEAENMKVNAGSAVDNSAESLNDAGTSVKATAGTSNIIVYGPYTREMNPRTIDDTMYYKATFRLAVSDNTNQNVTMGIDVFDGANGGPLASMQLRPGQFTAARTFQDFELTFKLRQGEAGFFGSPEFRLGTNGQGPDIYFDKVTVAPSANNLWVYEAENMLRPAANTVLACNNTCVQNGPTLQDWLIFGPYTRAENTGARTANFKMKIDNNAVGNEAIIIAVRNATTGVYQTARKVYPQEFTANDTFQDFPLAFNKGVDSYVYEYVAYYDRNWSGRTVSIDKITVQ